MTGTGAVMAILASAVIVLTGLVALVRAIWKIAQNLRDNTTATNVLTHNLSKLTASIDGRFDALVTQVEGLKAELAELRGRRRRLGPRPGPPGAGSWVAAGPLAMAR